MLSILFFVLTGIVLFLNSPKTQTWLLQKTTQYLSDKLETEVHIADAYVDIYTQIVLDSVLVKDLEGDTLLFVEALEVEVNKLALLGKKLEVKANVYIMDGFSAHADRLEIYDFIKKLDYILF